MIPYADTWASETRVRYHVIGRCAICDRRPGEMTIVIDDVVAECCGTCWERAEDERERDDDGG